MMGHTSAPSTHKVITWTNDDLKWISRLVTDLKKNAKLFHKMHFNLKIAAMVLRPQYIDLFCWWCSNVPLFKTSYLEELMEALNPFSIGHHGRSALMW